MWLPSKPNLYSLWYLLEGRYTGYVNSVCIHSVCKAENNELTLMRYICITLCPVWQPKQRKFQCVKKLDYNNNYSGTENKGSSQLHVERKARESD